MAKKFTYEELGQRVEELQQEVLERQRTQGELHRKIAEIESFINNIPDMAWLKDCESRFIAVNNSFGMTVGMDPKSLISQTCEVCFGKEAVKKFREDDQKVMKSRKQTIIEEKVVDSQNNEVWLETIKSPILNESGKVLGTVGIARDITRRKRAEETVQRERNRAQQYLDIAGVIMVVIQADQTVGLINRRGCEVLGYSDVEVIGQNWFDSFLPEQDREKVKNVFSDLIAGNIEPMEYFENDVLTKSGEMKTIAWHNAVLRDAENNIIATLSSGTDITERRQAEEALKKARDELEERVRERTSDLKTKTMELRELNSALRVLLRQRDKDKIEIEGKVLSNVKELILPYIEKLKKSRSDEKRMAYLKILESNLNDIVSPFIQQLSSKYSVLTPTQIQVAQLVKEGNSTKEIAELMGTSKRTVEAHRESIRIKLGLKNKKINLSSYLSSM
jgi:PAS domain S-box-containing protein